MDALRNHADGTHPERFGTDWIGSYTPNENNLRGLPLATQERVDRNSQEMFSDCLQMFSSNVSDSQDPYTFNTQTDSFTPMPDDNPYQYHPASDAPNFPSLRNGELSYMGNENFVPNTNPPIFNNFNYNFTNNSFDFPAIQPSNTSVGVSAATTTATGAPITSVTGTGAITTGAFTSLTATGVTAAGVSATGVTPTGVTATGGFVASASPNELDLDSTEIRNILQNDVQVPNIDNITQNDIIKLMYKPMTRSETSELRKLFYGERPEVSQILASLNSAQQKNQKGNTKFRQKWFEKLKDLAEQNDLSPLNVQSHAPTPSTSHSPFPSPHPSPSPSPSLASSVERKKTFLEMKNISSLVRELKDIIMKNKLKVIDHSASGNGMKPLSISDSNSFLNTVVPVSSPHLSSYPQNQSPSHAMNPSQNANTPHLLSSKLSFTTSPPSMVPSLHPPSLPQPIEPWENGISLNSSAAKDIVKRKQEVRNNPPVSKKIKAEPNSSSPLAHALPPNLRIPPETEKALNRIFQNDQSSNPPKAMNSNTISAFDPKPMPKPPTTDSPINAYGDAASKKYLELIDSQGKEIELLKNDVKVLRKENEKMNSVIQENENLKQVVCFLKYQLSSLPNFSS